MYRSNSLYLPKCSRSSTSRNSRVLATTSSKQRREGCFHSVVYWRTRVLVALYGMFPGSSQAIDLSHISWVLRMQYKRESESYFLIISRISGSARGSHSDSTLMPYEMAWTSSKGWKLGVVISISCLKIEYLYLFSCINRSWCVPCSSSLVMALQNWWMQTITSVVGSFVEIAGRLPSSWRALASSAFTAFCKPGRLAKKDVSDKTDRVNITESNFFSMSSMRSLLMFLTKLGMPKRLLSATEHQGSAVSKNWVAMRSASDLLTARERSSSWRRRTQ